LTTLRRGLPLPAQIDGDFSKGKRTAYISSLTTRASSIVVADIDGVYARKMFERLIAGGTPEQPRRGVSAHPV
jgi:hypothetical protein